MIHKIEKEEKNNIINAVRHLKKATQKELMRKNSFNSNINFKKDIN